MENKDSTALVKTNTALTRVSNQIAVTNRLLEIADPFLIPYRKGNKWGFCDRDKRIVIECIYDEVNMFSQGLAAVRLNEKMGYIDKMSNPIIPFIYDEAKDFICSGISFVCLNEKWGIIDKTGNFRIPVLYDYIEEYNDFFCTNIGGGRTDSPAPYIIWEGGDWGLVCKITGSIISCLYKSVGSIANGLILVKDKYSWYGYIDEEGEQIIDFAYVAARKFNEGVAQVKRRFKSEEKWVERWGYIDNLGNEIISCAYDNCKAFNNGFAAVLKDKKWGIIDINGLTAARNQYNDIDIFFVGVAIVKIQNIAGILNIKDNKLVLPILYDEIIHAGQNYFNVRLGKKWGMVNSLGDFIFGIEYQSISIWSEGYVALKKNNKMGYASATGEYVIPFLYDYARDFHCGMAIVTINGHYGFINKIGTKVIPCIYSYAWSFRGEVGMIKTNFGEIIYVDRNGTIYGENLELNSQFL